MLPPLNELLAVHNPRCGAHQCITCIKLLLCEFHFAIPTVSNNSPASPHSKA